MKPDVYILESTGTLQLEDFKTTYSTLLNQRLKEMNYLTEVVTLPTQSNHLENLTPGIPIILSGGDTKVDKDVEWLNQAKDFLKTLIKNNSQVTSPTPILGISFGAQLLAEVLKRGSVTDRKLMYPEQHTIQVDSGILTKGLESNLTVYSYTQADIRGTEHSNSFTTKNSTDTVNLYEVRHISCYGVQFHPEWRKEDFQAILNHHNKSSSKADNLLIQDIDNSKILVNFMELTTK